MGAIAVNHSYRRIFAYNGGSPRFVRWLCLCRNILISLLIDTLFYQFLYPDRGLCDKQVVATECVSQTAPIQSEVTMCVWDDQARRCHVRPPPSTTTFFIISSLLVVVIGAPLSLLLDLFTSNATKRPNVGTWNWLGDERSVDKGNSFVTAVAADHKLRRKDIEKVGEMVYDDVRTPREEAEILLEAARHFYGDVEAPWSVEESEREEKARAIAKALRTHIGGEFEELTLRQRLLHRNAHRRLENRIDQARKGAKRIQQSLNTLIVDGHGNFLDHHLIQHFILENLR